MSAQANSKSNSNSNSLKHLVPRTDLTSNSGTPAGSNLNFNAPKFVGQSKLPFFQRALGNTDTDIQALSTVVDNALHAETYVGLPTEVSKEAPESPRVSNLYVSVDSRSADNMEARYDELETSVSLCLPPQ